MRILSLLLLTALSCLSVKAQRVEGFAVDNQGKPLSNASIILKNSKDSSVVKLSISSATGQYEFPSVLPGEYFISISHQGYTSSSSNSFVVGENATTKVSPVKLLLTTHELKEVVITGHRPLMEVKTDKLVFNVSESINAIGDNMLELLRKSPGVTVDKDDNISLNGKSGLQIYIDGRPTYLSGNNLSEYLKTIPSSSVDAIEIITNPSAKYEAAGSAGIINVRLKKDKSLGTNATISGGYRISTYSKENGSISINNRTQKVNLFGDYSIDHNPFYAYANTYRTVGDSLFRQHIDFLQTTTSHTFKGGMDYFIDKKNTLGVVINGVYSDYNLKSNSTTPISYLPTHTTDRILEADNRTSGTRHNINADLNYRFQDTSGHELDVYADYDRYRIKSNQLQPNNYYDTTGKMLLYNDTYTILAPTDIDIYSLKIDYEQNFLKGKLGFGGKSSYVKSSNNFQEFDLENGANVLDSSLSNYFVYKENINALYLNYNRTVKAWTIQAGLRGENSNIKASSTGYQQGAGQYSPYDSAFTRHYTNLFPSASVTYAKSPMSQWTLSYSRRIDRPVYQDLNPFEFKLDEYTFARGNTTLRPQYTNSVGLTYMYKYKLVVTLNYSHINDLFTTLADTTDVSRTVVYKENLANQDIVSLNISYPFQIGWYSLFVNANTYYQVNKANFGVGRTIDLNVWNANLYTMHSFNLGHGWTGQITQTYLSPAIWQATLRAHSMWSVDGGLQKTLFKGNGTIKASVSDIFNSLHYTATSNFAGQYIRNTGGYESRQFKLYFTYRLGNKQLKAIRKHKNGSEEESKRVGSGNGEGGQ